MMSSTAMQQPPHIPYTPGIIDRPRLMKKLDGALQHKLTLVSAPPGYGKTTLVAQFARQSLYPIVWHTIEERERNLPNLYARCLSLVERIVPGTADLPHAHNQPPDELATRIADFIRERHSGKLLYVMDDVQKLTGSPAAEAWLSTLVALQPADCHLIIISRMLPDLPLAEMIARREVLAIGQEELRFTFQEIQILALLARESLGSDLSLPELKELSDRLEGWPAGTVLALHPLPAELERDMLEGGRGPEALFDALALSMLRAQPPRLRDFLLASSTLRRLTPELCADALQLDESAEWLLEIQTRNLFLSRAPDGLYYHTLFRDFLQSQLRKTSPDMFVTLHVQAARWFEEHGQIDQALNHYLTAGLVDRAAVLAEHVAQAFFSQGNVETLLDWGARLSQTGARVPKLLYTCAMIHTDRYEYTAAEDKLAAAARIFIEEDDPTGLANVQQQQAMLDLQRGQYDRAAQQSLLLLQDQHASPGLQGRALKVLGMARLRLGQVEEGVRDLEKALPLHRADGDAYALANVLQDLALAYSRVGRLADASACLQEVVALRRSLGSAVALALALNNLGCHYHRRGDYQQALETLQDGLRVVSRVPNKRAESYLLSSLGDLERDLGITEEALRRYNKAFELLRNREPSLRCEILVGASILRRWEGELSKAVSLAEEALKLATKHSNHLESAPAQAALWAARAQLGAVGEALEQLEALLADLSERGLQNDMLRVLALCAHIALLGSDMDIAEDYLDRALDVAEEVGSAQLVAVEIVHSPLLESVVSAAPRRYGMFRDAVKALREARRKSDRRTRPITRPITQPIAPHTYSLRVHSLGPETIERDGKPISSSEWRAASAREVFLYLLFEGSEGSGSGRHMCEVV